MKKGGGGGKGSGALPNSLRFSPMLGSYSLNLSGNGKRIRCGGTERTVRIGVIGQDRGLSCGSTRGWGKHPSPYRRFV